MNSRSFKLLPALAAVSLVACMACGNRAYAGTADLELLGSSANSVNYNFYNTANVNQGNLGDGGSFVPATLGGVQLPWVYCVDIPDHVSVPGSYANTIYSSAGKADYGDAGLNPVTGTQIAIPNSSAGGVAYLLDKYAAASESGPNAAAEQSGLQAAIWQVVYQGQFHYLGTNFSDPTSADYYYKQDITAVNYGGTLNTSPVSDVLFLSPHQSPGDGPYQALVTLNIYATPEPSSMAIAGLGGLGMLLYMRRRNRS